MSISRCSLSTIRHALNHLYDPRALQASPLVALTGTAGRPDVPTRLRQILIRAIESIKPEANVPAQARAWRAYEILHYRYVQQCSQQEVAEQLGLSIRHFKREQRKALEALAQHLRERFGLEIDVGEESDQEEPAEDEGEVAAIDDELRWLKEPPPAGPVELGVILPAVLELARAMAQRHAVHLRVEHAEGIPALAVHPVALRQILLSLLSVAIPRASGSPLGIRATTAGPQVRIAVQSAGDRRVQPPLPDDGANLAMARRLAGACGGSLAVAAADGSSFSAILTLPALEQVSVLVVDDNADALRLLERYASGTRYRVVGTQRPDEVWSLAQEVTPRIIVLDVMMPELDGWELLGRLRQHPLTSRVPVVVCTILAQEELAFSLGVSGYLRKPVSRSDLLDALDRLISAPEPASRSASGYRSADRAGSAPHSE